MVEIVTGTGLAGAAGLNAWIPLLVMGTLARFTQVVTLPAGWEWLSNGWVLAALAVFLVIEVVADKVPVLDHVNDAIHTFVRPASGGLVFGAGASGGTEATAESTAETTTGATSGITTGAASESATASLSSASALVDGGQWLPVVAGVLIALAVHLIKATVRAVLNTMSLGLAAPVLSTGEDVVSLSTALAAVLVPVLVLVFVAGIAALAVWAVRRRRSGRLGPCER